MTNPHWEKVAAGRYASELDGHIIQAIRTDGPHSPGDRPYMAVVDRKPIEPGAWSLMQAKTQAIQFVERQVGKSKAESVFKNGSHKPAEPPLGSLRPSPDPVDMAFEPDPVQVEPVQPDPEPVQPVNEPVQPDITPVPGQFVISGGITDADLLNALNALRSTMELLREHADIECTVNLPPVMRL